MTENSWPQDRSFESPEIDEQILSDQTPESSREPNRPISQDSSQDADSKKDAAKGEAGDVARHAQDAAQNVTETAKDEATEVLGEAKANARELLEQAKTDLTAQAGTQQQKVAEGLRSVSTELHSMVSTSEQSGMATDLVRQAAERSSSVASWLDARDPGSLLGEVKSYARQKPGTFLLLAAGAGILAGRISRNLSAPASDTAGSSGPSEPARASVPVISDEAGAVPPAFPPAGTPSVDPAGSPSMDPKGTAAEAKFGEPKSFGSEPVVVTGPPKAVEPLGQDPFDGERR